MKKFATLAIHAGQQPDPSTGAIMIPVYQTSTFVQSSPGVMKENYDYARSANPTRTALEANLAALENGKYGISFSSGCAAMAAVIQSLKSGDHVVLCDDVYGGTFRLFDKVFLQMGVQYTLVDMTDLKKTRDAFTPKTRLVWMETPTNPMLKVIDIAAVADLAHQYKCPLVVDNTFASPYLQNPIDLGADIVCHSCTKYIGGHSDVVGGVLVTNDSEIADKMHYLQNAVGGVPGPWDCFMLLRSTKTLHIRMERHCQNAHRVVEFLTKHPSIEKVYFPGLESHPTHQIAKKQMRDFGGMVSVVIKGGLEKARRFLERVELFSLGESLGGVESLIEHPAIMTHATIPPENRAKLGIVDGLVRLSVGIEDPQDLIDDLKNGLA